MQHRVRQYVHGYRQSEGARLRDQASTLEALLHGGTHYAPGSHVLEAGCGVGAQSMWLARSSPGARIVAVDISEPSLAVAAESARAAGLPNIHFVRGDIFALPFAPASFDHVFVCFVLEHLPQPVEALRALRRMLRPGGTITAIEGDHATACFHPDSAAGRSAIAALVEMQRAAGGDPYIGRRLYPLLQEAGFVGTQVSPRVMYVDGSSPELAENFTSRTFTAMIDGIGKDALDAGLIGRERLDEGLRALARAAEPDGTFCYTFFKAVAEQGPT